MTVKGRGHVEHLVADLEVPPGEVWKVKVTGAYTWNTNNVYINDNRLPSIMIGSKQTGLVKANETLEVEAYVSTVSRISLITDDKAEVTFEGAVEITPMSW